MMIHFAVHRRLRTGDCKSYMLNFAPSHSVNGCDYAYAATEEGIATLFAVRSIVVNSPSGNNAWFCSCDQSGNQDLCSEAAAGGYLRADAVDFCDNGTNFWGFQGYGDTYANDTGDCTFLSAASGSGCSCTDGPPANLICDPPLSVNNGHSNETQVGRFLWDLIDSNQEDPPGAARDNTDLTTNQLVAAFENMPCTGICNGLPGFVEDCGIPGTCNEPSRPWGGNCNPTDGNDGQPLNPPTPMSTTKDSYNARDLDNIVSGDQTGERVLNCVATAD